MSNVDKKSPIKASPERSSDVKTSRPGSPSSIGSKRERSRDEDEEDALDAQDQPPKKRHSPTPPTESPPDSPPKNTITETPRVVQIQRKVENLHVDRRDADPLNALLLSPKQGETSAANESSQHSPAKEVAGEADDTIGKVVDPLPTPDPSPPPEGKPQQTLVDPALPSPALSEEIKAPAANGEESTSVSPDLKTTADISMSSGRASTGVVDSDVEKDKEDAVYYNDTTMRSARPSLDAVDDPKPGIAIPEPSPSPEPLISSVSSSPRRARLNGLKRFSKDDQRPIDVDNTDKNLKRKASERIPTLSFSAPAHKRQKEDGESIKSSTGDEHAPVAVTEAPKTPDPSYKPTGFLAFASTASPFASVKSKENSPFGSGPKPSALFGGSAPAFKASFPVFSPFTKSTTEVPSVFGTKEASKEEKENKEESPRPSTPEPFPKSKPPVFGSVSSVGSSGVPRFGRPLFGAPTSPTSGAGPVRRAKSPRPQAFGAYAATAGRFAAPVGKILAKSKAAKGEDTEGKDSDVATSSDEKEEDNPRKTFSEILATTGSDGGHEEEEKKVYTEQDTVTGEEEETTIFGSRGKLYEMEEGQWKERGAGLFKLNVANTSELSSRVVMRCDGTHTLVLNAKLFKGMKFVPGADPRYVNFTILDDASKPKSLLIRFGNNKLAERLLETIPSYIPS